MARRNSVVRVIRLCLLAGLGVVAWVVLGTSSAHADIIPTPSVIGTVAGAVVSTPQTATPTVQSPVSTTPVTTAVAPVTKTQQPSAATRSVQTTTQTTVKVVTAVVAPVKPVVTAVVAPVRPVVAPVKPVVTAVVAAVKPVVTAVVAAVKPVVTAVVAPVVSGIAPVKPVVTAVVSPGASGTVALVKLVAAEVVTPRATDLVRNDVQSSLVAAAPSSSDVSALGAVAPSGLAGTSADKAAIGAPSIGLNRSGYGPGIVRGGLSQVRNVLPSTSPVSSQSADRTGVVAPFGAPLPAPGSTSTADGMLSTTGGSSVPLAAVTSGQWQHTVTAQRAVASTSWDVPASVGSRPDVSPG